MKEVSEQVTIHGLGGSEGESCIDDMYGILCQGKVGRGGIVLPLAQVDKAKDKPNKQLVEDYAYWFWNHG